MEILQKKRTYLRVSFTKAANTLQGHLDDKICDLDVIKGTFAVTKLKAEELYKIDDEFKEELFKNENDEEIITKEIEQTDSYIAKWENLVVRYERCVQKKEVDPQHSLDSSSTKSLEHYKRKFKLPKLELKKFDGDINNWLGFWGQFRKIDEDNSLDEDDKFQYLLQATVIGTSARDLVESYPPSGENYRKAIEMMKKRFARDDLLIELYVRGLLKLVLHHDEKDLRALYDKLLTQIQALDTLGVTKDKYAYILYPLVESTLPEEILRVWERHRNTADKNKEQDTLAYILQFLEKEVASEERIKLARTSFSNDNVYVATPTAACFTTTENKKTRVDETKAKTVTCIWCKRVSHASSECIIALKMTLEERRDFLKRNNACYTCLRIGHNAKNCRKRPKCIICTRSHFPLLCNDLSKTRDNRNSMPAVDMKEQKSILNQISSTSKSATVLLQTLKLNVVHGNEVLSIRALIDSGAQRSFIKKDVIEKLKLQPNGQEEVRHNLFGGIVTKKEIHRSFLLDIQSSEHTYGFQMEALEENTICNYLPKIRDNELLLRLRAKGIELSDTIDDVSEISLLIGADVSGSLLTGRTMMIDTKLVAVETKLGWTIQGPVPSIFCSLISNTTINNTLACTFDINDLWSLETLGIKDDVEVKSKENSQREVMNFFKSTIRKNEEDRYEVRLPWKDTSENLSTNYDIALKRLKSTTTRLIHLKILNEYDEVFKEWLDSGIIEEVENPDSNNGHYLPHHAVVKSSSLTTKIRPVFDASTTNKDGYSLNACLEKGLNMIELIPRLLIQFRKGAIGITADIKKAFLQISLYPEDRSFLKFLWWQDVNETEKQIKTFRHKRVVFGVTTSPFLLSATIQYHLEKYDGETASKLKKCYYVDNCVTTVENSEEMYQFVNEAKCIMQQGNFELRCWVTGPVLLDDDVKATSVLGLIWNPKKDELYCKIPTIKDVNKDKLTKRVLLSLVQSIFDPIGITCPTTIVPKIIIQRCWTMKLGWDQILPIDMNKEILDWLNQINVLENCRIPRRLSHAPLEGSDTTLHVFSDASQSAYSGCVFLRSQFMGLVSVQLVLAKSRVTPAKTVTMPRLELIAALMGTRLATEVKSSLDLKTYKEYYWTDSTIVLSWIRRKAGWNVFVHNRVKEITERTNIDDWHHVPGELNPADLPSRGCNAQALLDSRWWEGPIWLKSSPEKWPSSEIIPDMKEVNKELKKSCFVIQNVEEFSDRLLYFSKYNKIVAVVGWCLRFINNCRIKKNKQEDSLTAEEFERAEKRLIIVIQNESFKNSTAMDKITKLSIVRDFEGVYRVKTRLTLSDDTEDFKSPILLHNKHIIVERLVEQKHSEYLHAGALTLISNLRERFWIMGIRLLVKRVIRRCVVCRRHNARSCTVPPAPLPFNRIHCGSVFEVTGIDFAGPLYLKSEQKSWVALFTCATYRAVHLELCTSLSTEDFMMALRRFLARRGRVKFIYSDNGTNFQGMNNLYKTIDWEEVAKRTSIQKIRWRFIPPQAPWWGGFWERLIRSLKNILRRILGTAILNHTEMVTMLCECEAILNSRPLTYIIEDNESLTPLTPAMFLQDIKSNGYDVTDLNYIDAKSLNTRLKYIQRLREQFKSRFRTEYLSFLTQTSAKSKLQTLKPGDVVIIEKEHVKRINWPLALVLEIYPGTDGHGRVARLKTAYGERVRPLQRLFPLEVSASDMTSTTTSNIESTIAPTAHATEITDDDSVQVIQQTRSGRKVKVPMKLDL